jgi:DoxX-like protein
MENAIVSPVLIAAPLSKKLVWIGRVLSGLAVAFLLFDGAIKLVPLAVVIEATRRLGFPAELARQLGLVLIASTVLHLVPRTQVIGTLLLTAYLGGATAIHVRVGDPFWFPILMGVVLWAGLYLRSPRVQRFLLAARAA